ncbi:ABC transporter-like,P-loop containing nucleoside triphosphate hydrolase,AAA+ ATPase domain,ABC [Cinara cedri]|uniref:ABC transporter-like,P-loop containing nucleoside triphosphate hydrolase,AAA+ ATPase domain,ABC n=1 Tax=Cinara cedri TaxID=506608 RepID=A0A5E4MW51_9HEMI|nr:ABC transporter-like,P-loop containing nucleoside triphosphate hydrolase,AAA+ ATPase domain,ABC [Cinara cedri]
MAADDDVKYRTEDASNNNVTAKQTQLFPKKPEVDLSFKNLTYTVNTFNKFKRVKKEILHGVTGNFQSGKLTAIMGPSGCGKSTLLNVLAGYKTSGSSGSVYLNGAVRDETQMSNISCYIQQDDFVRDLLTARESMTVAANLKLPTTASFLSKVRLVEDLLDALGLSIHGNTITKRLSGGQKKRLSIALELITNPSILFIDEPTTGLDSQSCSQFVSLMVNLAHNQNRTMVCTLHQPSALLFEKFDQVYVLTAGRCIYQGPPNLVIPYFNDRGIVCPPYHNPADFLIEVAIGDYGTDVLSKITDSTIAADEEYTNINLNYPTKPDDKESQLENEICQKTNNIAHKKLPFKTKLINKPPSYLQAYHLYLRNVIMYKRNKSYLMLRVIAHLAISLIFGYLYRGVGNDASSMLSNMVFVYGTNLFLVYTGQMAVIVSFPLEYKVLKREHFNSWFTLFPYMISILLVEIPFQILCCVIYIIPAYVLTSQPLELMRFCYFTLFLVVTSLTSQSTGFLCGATLPVKVSVFIGPVFVVLLSVFGFAIRLTDIPGPYVWLYYFSFVRASFQSVVYSMYGFGRDILPCHDEVYCHYKNPVKFLNEMEFAQVNIYPEFFFICFFFLCTYVLTTTVIWYRLNKR